MIRSILIVDDEPIHRRGLSNMMKRLRPEYHIVDAKNGLEALEYIKCNKVDILITDIQMPIMDGLQLIEELRGITDDIKIIILSVYGYFDYAQKAISLGAFDYLLKPVDETKVEQVLTNVENKMSQESEGRNATEKLRLLLDKALPDILEHKMNQLVYGVLDSNEHEDIKKIFPREDCGVVIVSQLDHSRLTSDRNITKEIMNKIKYCINNILNGFGTAVSFSLQDETNSIVSIVEAPLHVDMELKKHIHSLNNLIGEVRGIYGLDMTVGVGNQYEKLFKEVKNSFKLAKKALKYKYFTGNGKVIFYNDVKAKLGHSLVNAEMEKELLEACFKFDKNRASQAMEDIMLMMLKDGYPKVDEFISVITKLLENLIGKMDEKLNTRFAQKHKTNMNEKLYECSDIEEMKIVVNQILFNLIDMIGEQKSNKNSTIIDTCKKYIEEHYMECISLESVAQEFYFNASYFSNFFKCNTNTNFSEYLNKTRMNHAKRLLQDNNYKIYEISKMIGYQDAKYFSRLFKKECGLTPDEYRRMIGMNKLENKDGSESNPSLDASNLLMLTTMSLDN